jgi:hypothetical protein
MSEQEFSDLILTDVTPDMKPAVRWLASGNTNKNLIRQLIEKSKQPHILEYTPNDAANRFINEQTYQTWLDLGHTVHWLLDEHYDLAGIMWYRTKQPAVLFPGLGDIEETFAIRLYENYVGHRLSAPFMLLSLSVLQNDLVKQGKPIPGLWLETTIGNEAALKSYSKFGFKEVFRDDQHVYMTISGEQLSRIIENK